MRRGREYLLPAGGLWWNDLGSWASLHEQLGDDENSNVIDGENDGAVGDPVDGATMCHAPGKMVALLGVKGLVVVETEDAIC